MRTKWVKKRTGYKTDSKTYLNQISILGDKGAIYTTPKSNGNYYFRTWISEEQQYYRLSLRTKSKVDALKRGEDEMLDILSKIKNGYTIFGMSWEELCNNFLVHTQKRVDTERITQRRYETIKTQINKWIIPFLGRKYKLSEIKMSSFINYGMYRRNQTSNNVQDITIRNEYTTINSIIRHGYRLGETPISKCEVEEIKITDPKRRDTFTPEEYIEFYKSNIMSNII